MFEPAQRPGTEPFRWRERELVLTDDRVPEATVAQPAYAYPGGPAILPRRPVRLTGGLGDFESVRRPTGRSAEATTARPAAASGFAVERLHGKPAIRARIRELMATARHEAVLCLPDGPGAEGGPEGARLGDAGLASRSVTVRTLCSERVRGDSDILRRVRTLAEHGVAVRAVSSLSARLHLVDRRTAVVQLGDAAILVVFRTGLRAGRGHAGSDEHRGSKQHRELARSREFRGHYILVLSTRADWRIVTSDRLHCSHP